jgi:hypothetical protein
VLTARRKRRHGPSEIAATPNDRFLERVVW